MLFSIFVFPTACAHLIKVAAFNTLGISVGFSFCTIPVPQALEVPVREVHILSVHRENKKRAIAEEFSVRTFRIE